MILKTSKTRGRKAHDHMVYLLPDGTGMTSIAGDGHFHAVRQVQGGVEVEEEGGGEVEEVAPVFEVEQSNNHTHSIIEMKLVKKRKKKLTDDEHAAKVIELYRDRKEVLDDSIKRGKRDREYYLSKQWPDGAEQRLKAKGRAHHNINEIKPKIDLIQGFVNENRTKTKFVPVEQGDGVLAEVMNMVSYHIDNQSGYSIEEEFAIENQIQRGMGVIQVRIDSENKLEPDVIVEQFNPQDVLFGPHEKLDASDCEYAIKRKWISKSKAKAMYPDIADKLEQSIADLDVIRDAETRDDRYDGRGVELGLLKNDLFDLSKKNIRILELLEITYRSVPVIFNAESDFYFNAEELSNSDRQKLITIPGLAEQKKVFTEVASTKTVGTVFAEHSTTIFKSLPIRPVYCIKEGDEFFSLIHFVIDLQHMANKSRSLYSDILNRAASYVWLYERGAFNSQQLQKFRKGKMEPGQTIEVEEGALSQKKIEMLQGTKIPGEYLAMEDRYSSMMFDHLGGNSVVLGQANTQQSALLFREFKRQALMGLNYLQRNLHITKKAIAKIKLEAISAVYSPERIVRLLNAKTAQEHQVKIEDILAISEGVDVLEFDVEVEEDSSAENYRQEMFAVWAQLLASPTFSQSIPPQISMKFLLELANPPGKDKLLAALTQQAEQSQEKEMSAQEAEVMKSQPDDIKRMQQGLPPQGLTNEAAGYPAAG